LENAYFCSSSRKAIILTTGIHCVFRGLKFEPDVEIGQKEAFCKGLRRIQVKQYQDKTMAQRGQIPDLYL